MADARSTARTAVTALVIGMAAAFLLYAFGLGPGTLLLVGGAVLLPAIWWRWRTREFRRGLRALRRGEREKARAGFERFLERVERDSRLLRYQPAFNLGRTYDYAAAAHNNLGVIALSGGARSRAADHFGQALERDPKFAPAHYGQAAVLLLDGDAAAAETAADAGLAASPGHRPCAILAALCRAERDDREGAEEILASLRKPITWEDARESWAKLYRFWGEPEHAQRWT